MIKYKLISTDHSSKRFGLCEICHQHVSEVFHQVEMREYKPGRWTRFNCHNLFGHKECLMAQQKEV